MANKLVDTRVMTVIGALRASITNNAGPGTSVNHHPNPFFLNVIGAVDLRAAADRIIEALDRDHPAKVADAATAASAVDGH